MQILRTPLLRLADNRYLKECSIKGGLFRTLSSRFVAGLTLKDGIRAVRELNRKGIMATLDYLGESVINKKEAAGAKEEYINILNMIYKTGVNSNISLKLTQMGLDIDKNFCFQYLKEIASVARRFNNFVRIDMESSNYTTTTLEIYRRLRSEGFDNVGVVIQAYLRRSEKDINDLIKLGLNVRICKGAYKEPKDIAFAKKKEVNLNFLHLLTILFAKEAQENNAYVAIATHDERIISWTKEFVKKHGIDNGMFEFQMLYGIRRDLQDILSKEGYKVRAYVPYGSHWYPYFMRRLAERPANLLFITKHIFTG